MEKMYRCTINDLKNIECTINELKKNSEKLDHSQYDQELRQTQEKFD